MANLLSKATDTSPTSDDVIYAVDDPAGTPADKKVSLGNAITKAHGLADGIVKIGTGVMTPATAGTDYQEPLVADTDYLTPTTASSTYQPIMGEDDNYVTDAEKTVIVNTSGTNTGDQALPDELNDFTDVNIVTPSNGEVLMYNSTTSDWENEALAGGGDMLAATYDPESVAGDAFDMDNMTQGTTNKFVTATDVTNLGNLSGTNTGDQTLPVKAIGSEVDTGTDDAKFLTAKSVNDSHNVPLVAPGTTGNVLTSNGTDWVSSAAAGGGQTVVTKIVASSGGDYTTVADALAAASDGWIILVKGTVTETGTTNVTKNGITIMGFNGGSVLDINSRTFFIDGGAGANQCNTIKDLKITTSTGYCKFGDGNTIVSNVRVEHSNAPSDAVFEVVGDGNISNLSLTYTGTASLSSKVGLRFGGGNLNNIKIDVGAYYFDKALEYLGGYGTISNYKYYSSNAGGDTHCLYITGAYTTVTNCVFHKTSATGGAYGIYSTAQDVVVSNCNFINIPKGVSLYGRCQIQGNNFWTGASGIGIYNTSTHFIMNCTISGNLFYNDGGSGTGISITGSSYFTNGKIIGNTFAYGTTGCNMGTLQNYIIADNTFESVTTPISGTGAVRQVSNTVRGWDSLNAEMRYMKNTSGGSLSAGQCVILKSASAGDEVTTSTTAGDNKIFGIAVEAINNDAYGHIQVYGNSTVTCKVDGTTNIAVGDYLSQFTTAGILAKASAGQTVIGMALAAYTADDSNGAISVKIISPRLI